MADASAAPSAPVQDPLASLRTLALTGGVWTIIGFGGAQVLRLAINLFLTRLLVPEIFGLMTLVFTVITGLNLFSSLGTNIVVISHPSGGDPDFLNTVWTAQVLRGLLLGAVCLLIASPVAAFYDEPRLCWLVPLLGVTLVMAGFNSTTLLFLRRKMAVKPVVILELAAQAASGVVMIVWARLSPGLAAIVAGTFAGAAIRLVWGHFLTPRVVPRLSWNRESADIIRNFGRWIWLSTLLAFVAGQLDRLMLGKLLTLQMLGVYGIAVALSEVPRALLGALCGNVIFPSYSKWAALPRDEYRACIVRARWPLLTAAGAVVIVLAVFGDLITRTLYDQRYASAAWMLPLLALGIWPSALYQTIEGSLLTVGQPRYGAFANLAKGLFTAVGIPLGFSWGGVAGAVIVVVLNDLPSYAPIAYGLWRERLNNFGQDGKATVLLLLALGLMVLLRWAGGLGLPLQGFAW